MLVRINWSNDQRTRNDQKCPMHGVDKDIHVISQQSAELVSDARMYLRGESSLKNIPARGALHTDREIYTRSRPFREHECVRELEM